MAVDGVDIETLLTPISTDAPTGIDVRTDFSPTSLYFRLRDARAEARAAERAAETSGDGESGNDSWRNVKNLALKILSEQAKDLEVAAWLTEALVRSDGLAGLAAGAEIIGGLTERYWDQLYPMPDEDGMETRVAPVTGLNGEGGDGTLSQPLNKLPLFNNSVGEKVMLFQYEASAELQTISDQNRLEARLRAGVVPYADMQAAARATSPGLFVTLRRNLQAAQAAWDAMGAALDAAAGPASPPTRRIRETLEQIERIVKRYAPPEAGAADSTEPEAEQIATETADSAAAGGGTRQRRLATREDALATLTEIANWFRKNEPQSPLAYTIDDAIRRGRMSWPDLIAELVDDETARRNILVALGIKPTDASYGGV
jgi:type VI secretion system protein ImpA